jgi:predicted aminopeptidase
VLRLARAAIAAFLPALLAGCQVGYYAQLIRGQYDLWSRREPIEQLLARPDTDAGLKVRLARALDARAFATRELKLPDNGSYKQYADLGRPYAVWNVFAAPEFSLHGHEWCFPFAGCVQYRGYFSQEDAREEAGDLRDDGFEVYVGGVPAYSTLGWFDDPLLNTLGTGEDVLAGTIFHELAHQVTYVKGDTAFNESFATFVEQEGLRRYLRDKPGLREAASKRHVRRDRFVYLVMTARERLEAVYASGAAPEVMRTRKQAVFEQLRADYARLKAGWGGDAVYDGWMAGELNNARLLPFGLYHEWVGAFEALFAQAGGDWGAFYADVARLAEANGDDRRQRLTALRGAGAVGAGPGGPSG